MIQPLRTDVTLLTIYLTDNSYSDTQSIAAQEASGCFFTANAVFKLLANDGKSLAATQDDVGTKASAIAKAAAVVTDRREKKGREVIKYASAQAPQRSFGTRWARRVMLAVLIDQVRHKDISTVMKDRDVDLDAETSTDQLWSV